MPTKKKDLRKVLSHAEELIDVQQKQIDHLAGERSDLIEMLVIHAQTLHTALRTVELQLRGFGISPTGVDL